MVVGPGSLGSYNLTVIKNAILPFEYAASRILTLKKASMASQQKISKHICLWKTKEELLSTHADDSCFNTETSQGNLPPNQCPGLQLLV